MSHWALQTTTVSDLAQEKKTHKWKNRVKEEELFLAHTIASGLLTVIVMQ